MHTSSEIAAVADWGLLDYARVIEERNARLELIRSDPEALAAAKIYYRDHPWDFIDDWVWTYDPRRQDGLKVLPLKLWPRQREFVVWLQERWLTRTAGLCEKSRDMGVTNLCLGFALNQWLHVGQSKVSFGSRKEALVDRIGDPDSIFEKGRMILRMLPEELLPTGYSEDTDATFMKLINRENGAVITGEAGDNIGRGGRSGMYFIDEAAFLERPQKVDAALSQNTDVRIDISSANGNANPFYRKRQSGTVSVFTFHWRSDPRKGDAWYEKQTRDLDPVVVASEIDIDYNASVEDVCIPATYVQAAVGLLHNGKLSPEFRDRMLSGVRRCGLDVADEGSAAKAYVEMKGVVVTFIEQWRDGNATLCARKGNDIARLRGAELGRYDVVGVGAAARGEFTSLKERKVAIAWEAINTGNPPPLGICPETKRKNKDRYANLRAWLWWGARRRFMRTWEHVNGIREHKPEDLVALPTQEECKLVMDLVAQVSRPKLKLTPAGKILIESKEDMEGPSIDLADSYMLNWVVRRVFDPRKHVA